MTTGDKMKYDHYIREIIIQFQVNDDPLEAQQELCKKIKAAGSIILEAAFEHDIYTGIRLVTIRFRPDVDSDLSLIWFEEAEDEQYSGA